MLTWKVYNPDGKLFYMEAFFMLSSVQNQLASSSGELGEHPFVISPQPLQHTSMQHKMPLLYNLQFLLWVEAHRESICE